jgi:glycosyltransferase involved in cell wall biosynthesis
MGVLNSNPSYSVIVPVGRRYADAADLHAEYLAGLEMLERPYELIFVLDGPQKEFASGLRKLLDAGHRFTVIALARYFGEATAIMAGFSRAAGDMVITLPAYHQIDASDIKKLVGAIEHCDVVIGRRWPRAGGWFERFRRWAFHGLLASVTHLHFHDLACGARALRRQVLEEIHLYGDQHRFLAVLANRQGFRVSEIDVRQSPRDHFGGIYGPRDYLRSLLDIFTVFFLARFTQKPLRFFGMIGVGTFGLGALWILVLVVQRLFFDQALADRPALLLSSLLLVLGLQVFALGLLGELIIFTHARQLKDYQIAEIIQFTAKTPATSQPPHEEKSSAVL